MKKRIAAAAAAMMILLGGCQATPEEGIVTSKNDGAFESALENAPSESAGGGQQAAPAAEQTVYEDSFRTEMGDVPFHVLVTEPTVPGPMPVLRVRPMELTGDTVKQVGQAFFGDGTVVEFTGEMNKAEAEQALLDAKQQFADWEYRITQDPLVDADDRDSVRENFEQNIAHLEQVYADAPETVEQKPLDWQFHDQSYFPNYYGYQDVGTQYIQGMGTYDDDAFQITARKRLGDDYKVQRLSVDRYVPEEVLAAKYAANGGEDAQPPAVDMDAALAKAQELLAAMGVGEFALVPDVTMKSLDWYFGDLPAVLLTPVYAGVPLTYHVGGFNPSGMTSDAYATNYGYEEAAFRFDEDGLVSFTWEDMHQVEETVNADVQMLPFDEILAAAEDQMRMIDMSMISTPIEGTRQQVEVTDVLLGLSRIRMKDSATDYYLVPTYTFYGTITCCDESGQPFQLPLYDDTGNPTGETTTVSEVRELAVINAVDGSAIDVTLGY